MKIKDDNMAGCGCNSICPCIEYTSDDFLAEHPWILKHCQNADVSNLGTRESDKYSLDDSSDLDSFRHLAYHSESDVGSTLGSSYSLSSTVESQG